MQIAYNRTKRTVKPQYIVIHDTGNKSKGADADAHFNYYNTGNRQSSADIFVDDKKILKVNDYNKYYTWHCGDGKGKYGISNANTVGVEICINSDRDYDKAVQNTIVAVRDLMKELDIPLDRVVRHYDASKKLCPATMSADDWKTWKEFKRMLSGTNNAESGNDIDYALKWKYGITFDSIENEKEFIKLLDEEKEKSSKLYWVFYKLANKEN
jgi:N-acetylmuramoyl-L-alanine amidase CwlA